MDLLNSRGKTQRVGTNAQIYCNVPRGKTELSVSGTTTKVK